MRAARGDDLASLQKKFLALVAALKENHGKVVPHSILKHNRGFFNIYTGRLLCPQDQLAMFDADPEEYAIYTLRADRVESTSPISKYLLLPILNCFEKSS